MLKDGDVGQLLAKCKASEGAGKPRESRTQQDQQKAKEVPLSPAVLEWKQKEADLLKQGLETFRLLKESVE